MKIICTVHEFGEIVRRCECCSCEHCVLQNICGDDMLENAVGVEIVQGENVEIIK